MLKTYVMTTINSSLMVIALCGCRTVDLSVNDNSHSISMNNTGNRKYEFVRHFSRDEKAYFTLFNLITARGIEIDKISQQELSSNKGDGIVNLKIKGQDTFVDQLIPIGVGVVGTIVIPTAGFFAASMIGIRTYTIEGDIVRYLDIEEPVKVTPPVIVDPLTGLPLKKEEKKIEFDPETGLPKKN